MAFTSILQRVLSETSHDQISCDLCDLKSNVYWKCNECDQILCSQCKIIHMRSTVSRDHSLQSLSNMDVPLKTIPINEPLDKNSKCVKHLNEYVQMFCKDCNELVCIDCVIEQHQGHNFAKVSTVALEMKQDLLMQASTSNKMINDLDISIKSLKQQTQIYPSEIEELIKQRQHNADELKSKIDTITNDLIADLRKRKKQDLKEMEENVLQLESSKMTLQDFVNTDQKSLHNMRSITTIRVAMEMKKILDLPENSLKARLIKPPKLRVNLEKEKCLQEIIGFIDDENTIQGESDDNSGSGPPGIEFTILDSRPEETNLEVISKFKPEIKASRIYPVSDSKAWIGNYCTDLLLYTISGNLEKRVRIDFDIYDFASDSCEDLFLTQYNGCTIHKLQTDGQCSLISDTSPLRTRGISVNKNNNILVVLTDQYGNGEKLIKMSSTGQLLQTMTINMAPSILRPSLVQESSAMDICVLDSRKAVVVLDKDGNLKFEHTGLTGIEAFAPRGVTWDRFGNILVSDSQNLVIYLLNHHGEFLKYIMTKEDGLQAPHKISLDSSGQLWIADWHQIKVIRY